MSISLLSLTRQECLEETRLQRLITEAQRETEFFHGGYHVLLCSTCAFKGGIQCKKEKVTKNIPSNLHFYLAMLAFFVEGRLSTFSNLNFLYKDETDQAAREYVTLPLGGKVLPHALSVSFGGFQARQLSSQSRCFS